MNFLYHTNSFQTFQRMSSQIILINKNKFLGRKHIHDIYSHEVALTLDGFHLGVANDLTFHEMLAVLK